MKKLNNSNANSRIASKHSKLLVNALSTALHEFANAHENKQVAALMRLLDSFHMKMHSDTLFLLMSEKRRLKTQIQRMSDLYKVVIECSIVCTQANAAKFISNYAVSVSHMETTKSTQAEK